MERFVKGDIVVTPFPLSDLRSNIRRPALVIADLKGDDLILCQITSKDHKDDPYQISITNEELTSGQLKISSFVKPSTLFTIRNEILLYRLGKINNRKLKEIEEKVCEVIKS